MALLSALDAAISRASIRERHCLAQAPSLVIFQSQFCVSVDDNTDTKPPRHSTFRSWSDGIPQLSQAMVGSLLLLGCSIPVTRTGRPWWPPESVPGTCRALRAERTGHIPVPGPLHWITDCTAEAADLVQGEPGIPGSSCSITC